MKGRSVAALIINQQTERRRKRLSRGERMLPHLKALAGRRDSLVPFPTPHVLGIHHTIVRLSQQLRSRVINILEESPRLSEDVATHTRFVTAAAPISLRDPRLSGEPPA